LGAGGRRFESDHPDHHLRRSIIAVTTGPDDAV
jgi:hypothetical protein